LRVQSRKVGESFLDISFNHQNQLRNQRRKLNKIQMEIKAARTKLDEIITNDNDNDNTYARDSFGGRGSMK